MQKLSSRIKFLIKSKSLFSNIYRKFFYKITNDPVFDQNKLAKLILGYNFHCENPRTFNEYIVWLKLNYQNNLWERCSDKIEVKKYLEEIGLKKYIPLTYEISDSVEQINFDKIPDICFIKTNNDSGSVFLFDKRKDNKEILEKIKIALNKNYADSSFEWSYKNIKPKVFFEETLEPLNGKDLIDYKFFMFKGQFGFGFSAHNRNKDIEFYVFDKNYDEINCNYIYKRPANKPSKPDNWNQLMEIAEIVGSHFEFVRVDLYNTKKGPKIGELTFFSQSGMGKFLPNDYDYKFGKLFENTIFYNLAHKDKKDD